MTTSTIDAPNQVIESGQSWLGPPLRTLRQPAFETACAALMRMVAADYTPTVIVGIRTGGLLVAEAMVQSLPTPLPVLPLTCRRASTGAKTRLKLARETLARLPRPIADALRRLEHRWIAERRTHDDRRQTVDQTEAEAAIAHLHASARPPRVLIADDAVDSGVTLVTVLQLLRNSGPPGMELRSAVITQTLEQPRILPDYKLYSGTLCRFPWSLDAVR